MEKIILISGKARHGKDTVASFLKESFEVKGKRVLICHYSDLLKFIAATYLGWDGKKDEKGRRLLQRIGTDVIRVQEPNLWVDFVIKMLRYFGDEYDYVLVPDTRFPNEVDRVKDAFGDKAFHARVVRPNFDNDLTQEQRNHPSETALDGFDTDFVFTNDGTLDDLRWAAHEFVVWFGGVK